MIRACPVVDQPACEHGSPTSGAHGTHIIPYSHRVAQRRRREYRRLAALESKDAAGVTQEYIEATGGREKSHGDASLWKVEARGRQGMGASSLLESRPPSY